MKEIYKAKEKYYINLNEIKSPEDFWKIWSKAEFNQQTATSIFKDNDEFTIEKNKELLAQHFIKPANEYKPLNITDLNQLDKTSTNELDQIIKSMNNKKSPGVDGVTNKMIKIIYENDKKNQDTKYFQNKQNDLFSKT